MAKVTEALASQRQTPVFICDFSPPRGGGTEALADASQLDADFICVAYNPGKAVRVDSISAAYEIGRATGRGTVFNLSPRDMNKLALQSRLLGAQTLGLQNLLVIQGDPITERDGLKPAGDYTATGLIGSIRQMNEGLDYKGSRLRAPTDFCIGASLDLSRGVEHEAALAYRKAEAGAHFFVSQPLFEMSEITTFLEAYERVAGLPLAQPVFWGLQILAADGVLFSTVPEGLRRDLANGRDGLDIALEIYALLREAGIGAIYLVSPIMRGGARDYAAAARFLAEVSA